MYNYYIEMDLKNYTTIITNLSIVITFIYCIILIIDELYNIGLFSFKYTYLYNYGSFISDFNNIQTIECETNRYNLYSNDNFIYKDIFSKSYFNYLIIIAITFITILFVLAYGINFYFTFIINQPEVCSFYKSTSFIKIIMKCLCDTCHEFIPDCTGNYFITFIILFIIPLSYFLKSFLNIDITPNSASVLFSFGYIILFILLLFTYSFILFNINKTDNNTTERLKNVGIYFLFTIIFILSGYIYKYVYYKYTNITLNKSNTQETLYDIYKQSPPLKPRPISEPVYKGINLLKTFKYDPDNKDIDYKRKKEIIDEYYISIRNYDKDMNYYTQKYNNYINSKDKLGNTITFINIIINILGLNNYMHIYVIGLLIFTSSIYYFYNNDLLLVCVIYLLCILTILTIINAILYYNTIVNKYIIYEPLSYYKNDITNTNTKLNLLLDPSNGEGFYNILTNNQLGTKSATINISPQEIITNVKSLTIFENFTYSNISNINSNCSNLIIPTSDNIILPNSYDIYYESGSSNIDSYNVTNVKKHIFSKIDTFTSINNVDIFNYNYNPITFIDIYYKDNNKIRLENLRYYNRYIYYYSYLLEKLLIKLGTTISTESIKEINKYKKIFNTIKTNYINYELDIKQDITLRNNIDTDINTIKSINNDINTFFNNLNNFIKENIIVVNKFILKTIDEKITQTTSYFIYKLNISSGNLIFQYTDNIIKNTGLYYEINIKDSGSNGNIININSIRKDILFKFEKSPSSSLLVAVPSKIIDNNFNELYMTSIANTPLKKIIFKEKQIFTSIDATPINYKKDDNIYNFNTAAADNITYTPTPTPTQIISFKAPYILKEHKTETSENLVLKTIILSSLLYNLIHITSKYEYQKLKNILYYNSSSPKIPIKDIERVDYSTKFSVITITELKPVSTNFLSSTEAYIVLLYNIYTYDKNRIIDIIEYFIYNVRSFDNSKYTNDEYLNKNILSIKTQIDKTVIKTELIKSYEKNRYILNLILGIYDNLIKYIKKEIETKIDSTLCHSTSATQTIIEKQLFEHLETYFDINNNNNTSIFTTSIKSSIKSSNYNKTITDIGMIITNFFNICIFLLDNIDAGDKIEDENTSSIVSNFKFYNIDDTINLDVNNLENVRKNLTINCDYYSKYNNMDKKQKLYMKTNVDNVGYSFPILIIIFVAIFGETAFIKS